MKTSLCQTLFLGETVNNIIGRTMNPRNQKLSCGGSSGGEGALQAMGGSSVGVGTDIGKFYSVLNGKFLIWSTRWVRTDTRCILWYLWN